MFCSRLKNPVAVSNGVYKYFYNRGDKDVRRIIETVEEDSQNLGC